LRQRTKQEIKETGKARFDKALRRLREERERERERERGESEREREEKHECESPTRRVRRGGGYNVTTVALNYSRNVIIESIK
jgi:hypothetical protein